MLQETRHWHEDTGITTSGREKSDAEDYRYFPEPDLVPVAPSREWVEELRGTLPENPTQKRARLQAEWGFSDLEMRDTVAPARSSLVEETIAAGASPQAARKWWLSDMARRANEAGVELTAWRHADRRGPGPGAGRRGQDQRQARPPGLRRPARRRGHARRDRGGPRARDRVRRRRLGTAVDNAIAANPDVADKIRDGKVAAAGALIGAVMKEMRGQADAGRVRELILEKLT